MQKRFTKEVTKRFIEVSEALMEERKIKLNAFCSSVGISSSNYIRMKSPHENNNVPVECLCKIIHEYKISPVWLLTGVGDHFNNTVQESSMHKFRSKIALVEGALKDMNNSLKVLKKQGF